MSAHRLPVVTLLAAFAATAALAWAAAGRRRSAPTVAAAMGVLQGALHLTFSTAGAHTGHTGRPATATPGPTAPGAHDMTGMTGHPLASPADPMDLGVGADTAMGAATDLVSTGGLGMAAVHLLAALLCGLWLAHGEAAFLTLAGAALAYAFTPVRLALARVRVPGPPCRTPLRARRDARPPVAVVLAHSLSRRGPPRPPAPRATTLGAHV
ncbi:hypothetical protein [Streptomyces sp. NPDC088557]|uniref:hypothetical protein n=1 Tax=Streptomyces sp. NPDC088557 TaxID=3365867 RepID=UPI0038008C85